MSLFEKYSFLYGERRFDPEERAEIGAFAMDLVKSASSGDEVGIKNLVNQHFAYADQETMDKVARYLHYFIKNEVGEHTKVAISLGTILGGIAIGTSALPVLGQAISSLRQTFAIKRSLTRILEEHPELRNDPNTARYFEVLTSFAPSIAANPLVAGNLLKRWHETGPAFITPAAIKELVSAEETAAKIPATQISGIKGFAESLQKGIISPSAASEGGKARR